MKEEKEFRLVLEGGNLEIVDCKTQETVCSFTIDELAEMIEFRYATPWNKSKDILEKLTYVLRDIEYAYKSSKDVSPSKEDIMREVKLRMHGSRTDKF
ncbi:hypothetical protein APY94_11820 [Thermococcus celericrescens]|uniref:Uncharacterized protein n=1 Tax=Thermococcus celericrescens TaxID=227598 RepID=A0A100XVP3_9EURY|nr:hypothetical protein [Thermococcus celericrescens]KUH31729.1 hypothetical protein APY94_11820 [Thermococcus celericrescens]